jgi:(hydroxyamino)benzene mutase
MERHGQLDRQGHRLIQLGALLFLLTGIEGFAISAFPAPTLGRSVHTLAALSGVVLIALGLVWPRLRFSRLAAATAFWTLIYSTFATIAIFVLAALWRAGASVIPLASQGVRGTPAQESVLQAIAYTAGPTALIAFSLILWGLRAAPVDR